MSAKANRETAANRANDLITQVRGAKEVSNAARQEIAELVQQASELGVSSGFTGPVVKALKKTSKALVVDYLADERTTSFRGKNPATMSNLGHMLYQMHVKVNPFSFGKRERQNPLTRAEFAEVKRITGNVGDGLTQIQAVEAGYMTADGKPVGAPAPTPAPAPMAEAPTLTREQLTKLPKAELAELLFNALNDNE